MSESVAPAPDQGLLGRAVGIITSPGSTFAGVVRSPRPAGILLLICVVLGLATAIPQFDPDVRKSALDLQLRQMERQSGQPMNPQARASMEQFSQYSPYVTMASMFIVLPVMSLLFAAIYWALFNAILGGTASFKQVLGIVTHSQVVAALGAVLAMPLIYMQGVQNMNGPFTLGALLPMLEPGTTAATMAGAIGFFPVWQTIVTAIGLAVLYRKKTTGIAIALLAVYLLFTFGITAAFSSFMGR